MKQVDDIDGSTDVGSVHLSAHFSDTATFIFAGLWDGNNKWSRNNCRYCHLCGIMLFFPSIIKKIYIYLIDVHQMQALAACRGMR